MAPLRPKGRARHASPANDDNLDITASLGTYNDNEDETSDIEFTTNGAPSRSKNKDVPDATSILDLDNNEWQDDDAFIKATQTAANRKSSNVKSKSVKKGGGFQAMGLNMTLLKAVTKKGFSVPTPIQRKTIPLLLEGLDVVGMARTGSGKTAAFVIPMIEKLKFHSAKVGARALIMSPSRELALQTMKVVKEFSKGTDLKCVLLVGGDSLEEQFGYMAGNPDIVIATPGRFLHLQVEMRLDLKSIQYVVFDEADRLFEMGFSVQLTEILHALPANRQTLLFSATLPKSLVEFAKAGLHEPSLVRLDADAKISTELESAFFTVKTADKEGALLQILQDIIQVPLASQLNQPMEEADQTNSKKRKRTPNLPKNELKGSHSTIIFAATKHHVEYLAKLLEEAGYPVAYVYGQLDQVARKNQVMRFRSGEAQILVVTDVAARGIDIPILANVINYDFPAQPKVFVHRVGRTARAGRKGWSYSLIRTEDTPYLLDLQLFLGRKLVFSNESEMENKTREDFNFASDVVIGNLHKEGLERCTEYITQLLLKKEDIAALKEVARKGEKMYQRSKTAASTESAKRAKEIIASKAWMGVNPLFANQIDNLEAEREKMLARVSKYRPQETVFEIGQRGLNRSEAANIMRQRREKIKIGVKRDVEEDIDGDTPMGGVDEQEGEEEEDKVDEWEDDDDEFDIKSVQSDTNLSAADENDINSTFSTRQISSKKPSKPPSSSSHKKAKTNDFQDSEFYMSYNPTSTSLAESRGYSVSNDTKSFAEAARSATLDLTNDEGGKSFAEPSKARSAAGLRWDAKSKKYVNRRNDDDGSRGGPKMIRGESGQKIAATFKSGRFEDWKKANKMSRFPRTGELEKTSSGGSSGNMLGSTQRGRGGRMFHKKVQAPNAAVRGRDDYEVQKKRVVEAKEKGLHGKGYGRQAASEVKNNAQISKDRRSLAKKKEKNARPSRKGKPGKSRR